MGSMRECILNIRLNDTKQIKGFKSIVFFSLQSSNYSFATLCQRLYVRTLGVFPSLLRYFISSNVLLRFYTFLCFQCLRWVRTKRMRMDVDCSGCARNVCFSWRDRCLLPNPIQSFHWIYSSQTVLSYCHRNDSQYNRTLFVIC